jgi:hypothetical protein
MAALLVSSVGVTRPKFLSLFDMIITILFDGFSRHFIFSKIKCSPQYPVLIQLSSTYIPMQRDV